MAFNFKDNVKVTKDVGWLLPGLEVKRWFFLIFLGSIMIVLGFMVLANVRPIYLSLELIRKAALILPSNFLAAVFIFIGAVIFFKGWQKTTLSIMDMDNSKGNTSILEKLYRRRKLNKGAKIVAIGGGTGLSMLLRGIKKYTNNITAIVTVGDDGGSSGRLREEMGILPPGDIRNCIAALADDEDIQKRWKFFLKTIKDNTLEFSFVITEIQTFLEPVFDAIVNEKEWQEQWNFIMKWNKNERSPKL